MIRADPDPTADPAADLSERPPAPPGKRARAKPSGPNAAERQAFPPPVPSWARASGRADGDPLLFAGAGLALLDATLRRDPPFAGALRSRLALQSAAASAKILRLNADAGALRDLRFAIGDGAPAARLLQLWRELADRSPSFDASRLAAAAAALDLPAPNAEALAESPREQSRAGDPVSAAAKTAAAAFFAFPDAPAAETEILALWLFDLVLAMRLRWPRPLPLIATKILDPSFRHPDVRSQTSGGLSLRPPDGGPRLRPGDPAWPKAAAGAIALAAAAALDLAEDCVSPAEAARHAPMTDRAARRLFDRLVSSSAARELSGRPAFRLYGL